MSEDVAHSRRVTSPASAFRVSLPSFEGPLDLLLHLIREHKLDIFDIPIALITEKYLEYLEAMRAIDLDVAGEFLVMAATLAHIKSRLLLPRQDGLRAARRAGGAGRSAGGAGAPAARVPEVQGRGGGSSPRQDLLDRDVFRPARVRGRPSRWRRASWACKEISVFKLIEALDRVLKALEPEVQHEVVRDRVSLSDAIQRIAERLRAEASG